MATAWGLVRGLYPSGMLETVPTLKKCTSLEGTKGPWRGGLSVVGASATAHTQPLKSLDSWAPHRHKLPLST